MAHIVDWFFIFILMVSAIFLLERLGSLFRKRSSKRRMSSALLEDALSDRQEP